MRLFCSAGAVNKTALAAETAALAEQNLCSPRGIIRVLRTQS